MSFAFHPEAALEFEAAVEWYEEHAVGLGLDFASEIHAAIQLALHMPLAWALLDTNIRRVLVNRFPYGVLYVPDSTGILVVAVMHLRRAPGYWKTRRTEP